MPIILIFVFLFLAVFGAFSMIRKRLWKELVIYGLLLLTGFILSFLIGVGVELPYAGDLITQFVKNVFGIKI